MGMRLQRKVKPVEINEETVEVSKLKENLDIFQQFKNKYKDLEESFKIDDKMLSDIFTLFIHKLKNKVFIENNGNDEKIETPEIKIFTNITGNIITINDKCNIPDGKIFISQLFGQEIDIILMDTIGRNDYISITPYFFKSSETNKNQIIHGFTIQSQIK